MANIRIRSVCLAVATLALAALGLGGSGASAQEGESTLRIAIPRHLGNLSVYTAGSSDADPMVGLVFDTLFTTPYVDEPVPLLAESAEPEPGNRVWTVDLREDVAWHDGEPFTAADVVFSYELYRDGTPNRWTHHVSEVPRMERIEAVDKSTVAIACAQPCPTLAQITLADLPILAEHQWRDIEGPEEFTGTAVGTGPYSIVGQTPERYELAANERYHAGTPVADRLVLSVIPEPSSAFLALRTGQVDAVSDPLPPQLVESFEREDGVEVLEGTPLSGVELVINKNRDPYRSRAFRRAAMLAIDKDRLLETVLLGRGTSGSVGWPHPESPWTGELAELGHDPEEARRLIADADLEGTEFEIFVPQNEPVVQRATELAAQDLEAVGIRASVRSVDLAALYDLSAEGGHDAYVWPATAHGLSDPTQLVQSFEGPTYLGPPSSREVAGLIEAIKRAPTIEKVRTLGSRLHRAIADNPPVIPFFYPEESYAVRPDAFDGWRASPGLGVVHKFSLVSGGDFGDIGEATGAADNGGASALGIVILAALAASIGAAWALRRRRAAAS